MGGWWLTMMRVRRGSGVGGLVQVKSGSVGLEVGRWRWCSALSGANHWRCLEARQAGRQARVLVVTLKPPVMWGVEVQRHPRQIPRLQSGPKEALLGSGGAEEDCTRKECLRLLRWCKERREIRARDDKRRTSEKQEMTYT